MIAAGHAFMQNLRRGHYELATDADTRRDTACRATFADLAQCHMKSSLWGGRKPTSPGAGQSTTQQREQSTKVPSHDGTVALAHPTGAGTLL